MLLLAVETAWLTDWFIVHSTYHTTFKLCIGELLVSQIFGDLFK